MNRGDFNTEPRCLWTQYPHHRGDILDSWLHVYWLIFGCVMHLVHGKGVPFDICSQNYKYTALDWAVFKKRNPLVEYLERLMMREELNGFL